MGGEEIRKICIFLVHDKIKINNFSFDLEHFENSNQGALTSEVHVEAESLPKRNTEVRDLEQSNVNGNSAQKKRAEIFQLSGVINHQ